MHASPFIQDLAIIMLIAGMTTVLFHRLKQPVVLGYILAGLIIGPYTPPYALVKDHHVIETMSELGVVFLMFSLGLEFSLRKLANVGMTAIVAALAEIVFMAWAGYEVGKLFGWSSIDSMFLGGMLAMSSTTVIIKVLQEMNLKNQPFARLVFGILIVEDILAIVIIALLSGLAKSGSISLGEAAGAVGSLTLFMLASLVLGILIVPRALAYVARFERKEMLLIAVLGICFGYCLLVIKLDYSIALGAFLIGAIIAESRELKTIEHLIEPIRDMFSAIFFVTIGMLINPAMIVTHAIPIAVITLLVVVGKIVTCSGGALVCGNDPRTSLRVGMSLAQIGEFSFIIAALGLSLKVTSDFLYPIAVAVSSITTLFTPYLIRSSDHVATVAGARAPKMVTELFALYTSIVGRFSLSGERAMFVDLFKRLLWQIAINIMLVITIFLIFAFVANHPKLIIPTTSIENIVTKNTILWSIACLCSLPMLLAAFQKIRVLSKMIAELSVPSTDTRRFSHPLRDFVVYVIPLVSLVAMSAMVLLLSSAILPRKSVMIMLAFIFIGIAYIFRNAFTRIHVRLRGALMEAHAGDEQK